MRTYLIIEVPNEYWDDLILKPFSKSGYPYLKVGSLKVFGGRVSEETDERFIYVTPIDMIKV